LLTALGLPAGSGDAEVLAAAQTFSAAPEGTPPGGATDAAAAAGQGAAHQATASAVPAAATTFPPASPPAELATTEGPEVVTITRAMWEQMEAAIAQAAESARQLGGQRKKELIGAALSQGRITAADVQSFSALFDKDEQQATALLTTLTPRIHTFSAGHSQVPAFAAAPVNGPATDEDARASMELLGLPYTGKAAS
jgi:pyruvate/2-oxoglutarate dehydrogenase complex dihydrolipoamide acyltransferase (E2) component